MPTTCWTYKRRRECDAAFLMTSLRLEKASTMIKTLALRCLFSILFPAMFLVILSGSTRKVSAHAMYQTAVLLDFNGNKVGAELQLPVDRLSISFKQTVDAEHFPAEQAQLRAYVLDHVHPVSPLGKPFKVEFLDESIQTVEKAPYLVVHLMLTPPAGASVDRFTLNYDVIAHEIVTHVVLISIRSDAQHPIPGDDPVLLGIIRYTKLSQDVDRFKR